MKNIILLVTIQFSILISGLSQEGPLIQKEYYSIEEALKSPNSVVRLNLNESKLELPEGVFRNFKNLEYLSLKNDHLKVFPAEIVELDKLKILDISGNDFDVLPLNFFKLKNLEELYLNDENYLNLEASLERLKKLPKLKSLHLENDKLEVLPSNISDILTLESLYLNGNLFKKVPSVIQEMKQLKYLEIHHNKIQPILQQEFKPNGNMIIKF